MTEGMRAEITVGNEIVSGVFKIPIGSWILEMAPGFSDEAELAEIAPIEDWTIEEKKEKVNWLKEGF